MSEPLGDRLIKSLKNVVAYERDGDDSNVVIRHRKPDIEPVPDYTKEQIKALRMKTNLTQMAFAQLVGVTVKAIEAWEAGKRKPTGTAHRLFQILENNPDVINGLIVNQ